VEGVAAAGGGFADGGVDVVCVSVMRNHYFALKIAPWGHDQQGYWSCLFFFIMNDDDDN
jgi:hypothetical protein